MITYHELLLALKGYRQHLFHHTSPYKALAPFINYFIEYLQARTTIGEMDDDVQDRLGDILIEAVDFLRTNEDSWVEGYRLIIKPVLLHNQIPLLSTIGTEYEYDRLDMVFWFGQSFDHMFPDKNIGSLITRRCNVQSRVLLENFQHLLEKIHHLVLSRPMGQIYWRAYKIAGVELKVHVPSGSSNVTYEFESIHNTRLQYFTYSVSRELSGSIELKNSMRGSLMIFLNMLNVFQNVTLEDLLASEVEQ